ncbi:hypothetical protein QVD17_29382 [Tagetes erecta]|uniref:Protein PHYTOCHROME KINASE SUBSTRATE 1-like n=1 Tax=Tagetes erecta TaxID=13708 RepID=A0AAD8KGE2_TARER|nr:hypothetical protein QVD17_29382 [Tagetes erecta]
MITTEERFMVKIMNNKVEDNELGVFGAEKYFKGVIDEELLRTSINNVHYCSNRSEEKHEDPWPTPKSKTPLSGCSGSSWNSRGDLLVSDEPIGNNHNKKTNVKSLLASLGCSCRDKGSVKIAEAKQPVKCGDPKQKTMSSSSKQVDDDDVNVRREAGLTFPVLNASMAHMKHPEPPEAKHEREQGDKCVSLETKLTLLNWGVVTPRAEILDSSGNGNDTGSDGSSDLFELESFSTNENNSFLAQQSAENNIYAPSEASINWSVMTASVAVSPTPKDLVAPRNVKGSGILSRCKNRKAVKIDSDEHCMTSGEKLAVVSHAKREWRHALDSTTPVVKIQANTKLIRAGSGLHISQNGFGVVRQVPNRLSRGPNQNHFEPTRNNTLTPVE